MSGSVAFFHTMAPMLTANLLTVTLIYCLAQISRRERCGTRGRLHHLWLVVMVLLFMLYGFHTWSAK
jgi:hypothetical protein